VRYFCRNFGWQLIAQVFPHWRRKLVWALASGRSVLASQLDNRDRDRDRERTVIKEREPSERTTVIKKEHHEPWSKTIIKERE
jgi:hypothetical protein